jgi:hypothetical protein
MLAACPPQNAGQPDYFTQTKAPHEAATCEETIGCYDACVPLVEECMLRCDQRSSYYPVLRARDVANCVAQAGCGPDDRECRDQYCTSQLLACRVPAAVDRAGERPAQQRAEPMPPQPSRQ